MLHLRHLLGSFSLALILVQSAFAQDLLLDPVVQIRSGGESGAGFLVGQQGETLYLLTAFHVIESDPSNIWIKFRQWPEPVEGTLKYVDPELDLAAISCSSPEGFKPVFMGLSISEPKDNQPLKVVGHPNGNDWLTSDHKIQQGRIRYGTGFTIPSSGIAPGNSGGPVLNEDGLLIGMVTDNDNTLANCVSFLAIKEACDNWKIPFTRPGISDVEDNMVFIPGGEFIMGNDSVATESPAHQVKVASFFLGKHEVTVGEFERFILASNYKTSADLDGGSNYITEKGWQFGLGLNWRCDENGARRPLSEYDRPVAHVSWYDAQAYCQWLTSQTGREYRLPSEAEWEYAAGGGSIGRTEWAGTSSEGNLHLYANFCDQLCPLTWRIATQNDGYPAAAPVGSYSPNTLKIYDMSGNVWEWCQDWYHSNYTGAPNNGTAWDNTGGTERVIKGGSWRYAPANSRAANRVSGPPGGHEFQLGFRIARTP